MKKNNNITCRIFLILGLIILSHPALAEKPEPRAVAAVCFEPQSGHQITLDSSDGVCPENYQHLLIYSVRKTSADVPPPQKMPKQYKRTEVRDVVSEGQ